MDGTGEGRLQSGVRSEVHIHNHRYLSARVGTMPRSADSARKPALVAQILDYLVDKPISALTFRSVAEALGVSTYTLVYHFGTRAQLIEAVVAAIVERQHRTSEEFPAPATIDEQVAVIRASIEWTCRPENVVLLRLEFEAALIEVLDTSGASATRRIYAFWAEECTQLLIGFGVSPADAELEARLLTNLFYGFQYDLVVNRDCDRARAAFEQAVVNYHARIAELIELGV